MPSYHCRDGPFEGELVTVPRGVFVIQFPITNKIALFSDPPQRSEIAIYRLRYHRVEGLPVEEFFFSGTTRF